jgi:hypothetical protein
MSSQVPGVGVGFDVVPPVNFYLSKVVFSKKATKFDKIFTVDLALTTYYVKS